SHLHGAPRHLPPFPTRRSSDLKKTGGRYEFQRRYPNGEMYAPVTGYYSLRYGSGGLEHAENEVLAGNDPRLLVRRLSDMFTGREDRKSTRLNSSHVKISYAVFC